jgi:hypothetical protein
VRVAIHQPNYAPWCGYFAKMRECDIFIFLDDAQMTSQSYVYRCAVRRDQDMQWLSIPTNSQPRAPIHEVRFHGEQWARKHIGTLRAIYGRCPFFKEVFAILEPLYQNPGTTLGKFNMHVNQSIAAYLGLSCRFEVSSSLQPEGLGDDRLISLARRVGADTYISGKGGQNYQSPAKFAAAGIVLEAHEYRPMPYIQHHGAFVPGLSILDALFHLGREAIHLLDYPKIADNRVELAQYKMLSNAFNLS